MNAYIFLSLNISVFIIFPWTSKNPIRFIFFLDLKSIIVILYHTNPINPKTITLHTNSVQSSKSISPHLRNPKKERAKRNRKSNRDSGALSPSAKIVVLKRNLILLIDTQTPTPGLPVAPTRDNWRASQSGASGRPRRALIGRPIQRGGTTGGHRRTHRYTWHWREKRRIELSGAFLERAGIRAGFTTLFPFKYFVDYYFKRIIQSGSIVKNIKEGFKKTND